MNKTTAILVDGGFFLKRYQTIKKPKSLDPEKVATDMWQMCIEHLKQQKGDNHDLYRIFYYDCLPYSKKQHNPVTGRAIDFSKTDQYAFRKAFFEELKKKRKIALRLGEINDGRSWIIRPSVTKKLLNKSISIDDLTETDVISRLSKIMIF